MAKKICVTFTQITPEMMKYVQLSNRVTVINPTLWKLKVCIFLTNLFH
jgi:hypothetical protein